MIDWERVAELLEEVGTDAFGEVADMFLAEIDEAADRLMQQAHPGAAADSLHFLKGAALNLGFADLAEACLRAEAELAAGADARAQVAAVLVSLDRSRVAFLAGRAEGRPAA